ncbi:hypothetical protein GGD38_003500 [Chitinophagaceae bacterium OAS944]|nr:hypothetical protein [Chitinophagaceae bacterium OAS944]
MVIRGDGIKSGFGVRRANRGQPVFAMAAAGQSGHKVFKYEEGDYFCDINYLL